jgi:hypothetical protein
MQRAIELVNGWLQHYEMELSTSKTKKLQFCRKHICEVPDYDQNISVYDIRQNFWESTLTRNYFGEDKSMKADTKDTRRKISSKLCHTVNAEAIKRP